VRREENHAVMFYQEIENHASSSVVFFEAIHFSIQAFFSQGMPLNLPGHLPFS
jgi:hypothetical protein